MIKKIMAVVTLLLPLLLSSCAGLNEDVDPIPLVNIEAEVSKEQEIIEPTIALNDAPLFLGKPYKFVEEEALSILVVEDDYMRQFSPFDYLAKFGLEEVPESLDMLKPIYAKELIEWSEEEIQRITKVLESIEPRLEGMKITMPDELWFINETGKIEGGAAYTRGNGIILPRSYIGSLDDRGLERLVLHELFHVISRYNKELRPEIYGVIHYEGCEQLVIEGELANRLIANPDAPDLNYFIRGNYEGEEKSFIPILYSEYDVIASGETFFSHLHDDMLMVEIIEGKPVPSIDTQGNYRIVSKNKISNYYELIGGNTSYTFHPEETMADNFVYMVLEKDDVVPDPWVLEALRKILW